MKYRVLITGQNKVVIDDFFSHMQDSFECQNSSTRYEDIMSHLEYFKPHVFVYCLHKEAALIAGKLDSLKQEFKERNISFVLIGSQESCDEYTRSSVNAPGLILTRPFTATLIEEKLGNYLELQKEKLEALENRRQMEEEAKRLEEAKQQLEEQQRREEEQKEEARREEMRRKEEQRREELDREAREEEQRREKASESQLKRILVVDDDPVMLKTARKHIGDRYEVASAISGKLALKYLETRSVDLILLDYEMPGENGADVLAKLRENEQTSHIPVVFLTGISERSKIQQVLSMKPQGYLLKPIKHDILLSTIEEALK